MSDQNAYSKFIARIKAYRSRSKFVRLFEKSAFLFSVALTAALALPVFYFFGENDPVFRWILTIGASLALVVLGVKYLILPLFSLTVKRNSPSIDRVALQIGDGFPQIKDKLSNAFQLIENQKSARGTSEELAQAAFDKINRETEQLDFRSNIETRLFKRNLALLGVTLALFLTSFGFYSHQYARAFDTLLNPQKDVVVEAVEFEVQPGNAELIRGDGLEIVATAIKRVPEKAEIVIEYQQSGFSETMAMTAKSPRNFTYAFENITEPFSYRVRGDGGVSETFDVSVIELPDVRELQLTLDYPDYTALETKKLDPNIGSFSALPGTRVLVEVMPNKSVTDGWLCFAEKDSIRLQEIAGRFSTEFIVKEKSRYRISLRDARGLFNRSPITYQVDVVPDQFPVVDIILPGKDVDLDESMEAPIVITGDDDFGFSKLELVYEVRPADGAKGASGRKTVHYFSEDGKLRSEMLWDLIELTLFPDDVVEYYAELFDNDTVNGPKAAKSNTYRLRFPSMAEIFNESRQRQENVTESVEELLEETEAVRETINEMINEMRRQSELEWEDKQKIKESASSQQEMMDELESVQEQLEEMVDNLEKNDLLSPETLEKYQELQNIIEDIATPELQEALEKLQKAVENVDPEEMQKALEQFELAEEQFQKSLEKTINLLKQLQAEQRLDEAVKTAEEMMERQESINEQLKNANNDSTQSSQNNNNQMADQQQKQQESLSQLQEALDDLQQKAEETPQMRLSKDRLKKAEDIADGQQLQQEMERMTKQLRRQQNQQAQQSGGNISQSLQKMYDQLSQAQQEMQQMQKSEVMNALRRGMRDLLQLSKNQENLAQDLSGKSQATTDHREAADQQQNQLSGLQRITNQLSELSQQSFFMPPELMKELGEAMQNMQKSIGELEGQRGRQAAQAQEKSRQGLDGAAGQLRSAMKSLGEQGGQGMGGGMEQLMEQLEKMAGQQEGLNGQTMPFGNNPGNLTPQQQAQLGRLAARQEALRRAARELAKEHGQRKDMLGSLDKIGKDMEEVAKDMQRKQVNRQTIDRQKRILSRLLDAKKSMNQREYSRKRKAETGKEYLADNPGALPDDLGEAKTKIQQDLLRALKEGYSRDYKALIQKYFEALKAELQAQEKEN